MLNCFFDQPARIQEGRFTSAWPDQLQARRNFLAGDGYRHGQGGYTGEIYRLGVLRIEHPRFEGHRSTKQRNMRR